MSNVLQNEQRDHGATPLGCFHSLWLVLCTVSPELRTRVAQLPQYGMSDLLLVSYVSTRDSCRRRVTQVSRLLDRTWATLAARDLFFVHLCSHGSQTPLCILCIVVFSDRAYQPRPLAYAVMKAVGGIRQKSRQNH